MLLCEGDRLSRKRSLLLCPEQYTKPDLDRRVQLPYDDDDEDDGCQDDDAGAIKSLL